MHWLVRCAGCNHDHSWLVTKFVTRVTRCVSLVEQELLTHQEHLSSPTVISEVHIARSLVFCVVFLNHRLSFCPFSIDHRIFCPLIYGFWLPPSGIFKLFLATLQSTSILYCGSFRLNRTATFFFKLLFSVMSVMTRTK